MCHMREEKKKKGRGQEFIRLQVGHLDVAYMFFWGILVGEDLKT